MRPVQMLRAARENQAGEDAEAPDGAAGSTLGSAAAHRGVLYERLAADVEAMIDGGALRAGARLPSVRRMAGERGVSVSTVVKAYDVLRARGLLEARRRSGYYVRPMAGGTERLPAPAVPDPRDPREVMLTDLMLDVMASSAHGDARAFGTAVPEPALLPAEALGRELRRATRTRGAGGDGALGYAPTEGLSRLRSIVARRALAWGGRLDPERLLVTAGATEALSLALRAVAQPGDTIVIETPTYFGILHLLASLGLRAVEVPTDPVAGVRIAVLAEILRRKRVAACLFVPNFQNPLGALMSDEAKARLVRLLSEHDVPLIEDDVFGDLSHGSVRPAACKAFDATGDVLYVSSVSKSLAPGYRIGWIAPGRWYERVRRLKAAESLTTPTPTQHAVAAYLERGAFERHLSRLRSELAAAVRWGRATILERFPQGTRVTRPHGGFVLWVQLPPGNSAVRLYHRARRSGIGIAPGPIFSPAGRFSEHFRISLGVQWRAEISRELQRLGRLVADVRRDAHAPVVSSSATPAPD